MVCIAKLAYHSDKHLQMCAKERNRVELNTHKKVLSTARDEKKNHIRMELIHLCWYRSGEKYHGIKAAHCFWSFDMNVKKANACRDDWFVWRVFLDSPKIPYQFLKLVHELFGWFAEISRFNQTSNCVRRQMCWHLALVDCEKLVNYVANDSSRAGITKPNGIEAEKRRFLCDNEMRAIKFRRRPKKPKQISIYRREYVHKRQMR